MQSSLCMKKSRILKNNTASDACSQFFKSFFFFYFELESVGIKAIIHSQRFSLLKLYLNEI